MTDSSNILPTGWWHERDLLVLYGEVPGVAVAARTLREKGQQRMVCVVPETSTAQPGEEELPEGVQVVRRANELMSFVQRMPGNPPAMIHLYVLPGTEITDTERRLIGETLAKAVKSFHINRTTLDQFGDLWMRQTAENLGSLGAHPTVAELRDKFGDRPVVVVSPGPSLTKNIAQLKELVGRAVIMTCPHALAALEAEGIVPDIVVVGDAKTLAWQYGDYDFSRIPALVVMAPADPGLFELGARNVFLYSFNPDIDGWAFDALGKRGFLASGGSVACTELSLAQLLGAPEIYYVGQDLAFEGGRYYASTVRDGETVARVEDGRFVLERNLPVDEHNHHQKRTWLAQAQQTFTVPGWGGGEVETSHVFTIFLDWFSVALRSQHSTARVFNCTEGGAYIDGMVHVPLAQVVRRVRAEEADIPALIEACVADWDSGDARARMLETVEEYLRRVGEIGRSADRCLSLATRAANRDELLPVLEKAERKLSQALSRVHFMALAAQAEVREAEQLGASGASLEQNLEAAARLFRVVRKAASELRPRLEESRQQLRSQATSAA